MSAVPSASPPELPPRVLLLDDDPMGRLLAGRALRERGFDLVEFDPAQQALEAIEGGGFDCAVYDLLMPEVDGIEFCRRVLAMIAPEDRRMLRRAIASMLGGGAAVRREVEIDTLAGRTRRLRIDLRQVTTDARAALDVAGTVRDVTLAGGRDETIHRLTRYDALTGLPNRTWLLERLRRPRSTGARGLPGLAVLDIDRFHHVGEALGQSASERLLVEVAQRLRRLAAAAPRGAGAIEAVVNLRGSEFALLPEGLPDAAAGLAIARDAVASLDEPFRVEGREVFLRASVGVHAAGPNGDDGAQRLGRAELSRRAAAGAGGHCALAFEPAMAEPGYDRLEIERGLHCALSVNLSCQQLRTGRLPGVIAAALAAHRLPADRLALEVTESGMMADPEVTVAQLKAVRALGAGPAVDDFGTGYSSLAYLTRLPLTTLKIDRSFVQDVRGSERSSAVAPAIVALGANLQLQVVAEGVETVARRDALISLGCNLQQGFLYAREVPLDKALSLADRRAIASHRPSLESVS